MACSPWHTVRKQCGSFILGLTPLWIVSLLPSWTGRGSKQVTSVSFINTSTMLTCRDLHVASPQGCCLSRLKEAWPELHSSSGPVVTPILSTFLAFPVFPPYL